MTGQVSYTKEELESILGATMTVGFGVILSDFGVFQATTEMKDLLASIGQEMGSEKFKDNSLIQSIMEQEINVKKEWNWEPGVLDKMLAEIREVSALIDGKSPPEEAQQVKRFLYELAEKVANSSGEGFLGLGPKVSKKESDFLADLKIILDL